MRCMKCMKWRVRFCLREADFRDKRCRQNIAIIAILNDIPFQQATGIPQSF